MKIYIIHSFSDSEIIDVLIQKLNNLKQDNLEIFHFPSMKYKEIAGHLWKKTSWENMIDANLVLFCVSNHFSEYSENIIWELNLAKKIQREVYLLKLDDDFYKSIGEDTDLSEENKLSPSIDESLQKAKNILSKEAEKDGALFDKNFELIPTSFDDLTMYIEYHKPKYDIKSSLFQKWNSLETTSYSDLSDTDKNILFEQYKLMLTTSESLTDRRQGVSSFYITLNCAIFAFIGAMSAFNSNISVFLIVALVMSMFGIALSIMWAKMIDSYGQLNSGKFKIINAIEKVLPAAVFDAEWIAIQSQQSQRGYVSYTKREKNTPKLFGIFYIIALITILTFLLLIMLGVIVV